jgi:hypothetical protein
MIQWFRDFPGGEVFRSPSHIQDMSLRKSTLHRARQIPSKSCDEATDDDNLDEESKDIDIDDLQSADDEDSPFTKRVSQTEVNIYWPPSNPD